MFGSTELKKSKEFVFKSLLMHTYNHFLFNLPLFFGATLIYNKTKYLSFVDVIMAPLYKLWSLNCELVTLEKGNCFVI